MAATAVVFAYHDVGVRCLSVLLQEGVSVPLVVTHRDDPDEKIWFSSVYDLAVSRGIEVLLDPTEKQILEKLQLLKPDFIFSFYFRRMLSQDILALAKRGAYNMHGSLLPKYRGRAPVNWAVLKGETETGATLHEMVAKPDAGGIVGQERVPIGPDDLAVDVFRKVTNASEKVLKKCISDLVKGTARAKSQDLSAGSYFGARKPVDGRIDWSRPAREIHNLVRAVAPPYPGAFTIFQGKRFLVLKSELEERPRPARAQGPFQEGGQWFAGCGDGKVLRLLEVEFPA
jgi:methionyl-tRNA formyltransferase